MKHREKLSNHFNGVSEDDNKKDQAPPAQDFSG